MPYLTTVSYTHLDVYKRQEYMCVGGEQKNLILEDEQEIINCSSYKYLGTTVTQVSSLDKAIRERNNLGRKSIALLNNICLLYTSRCV